MIAKIYLLISTCRTLLGFVMSTILFVGCSSKIRISDYSKYNTMDSSFIKTYENDSLKTSIYFWGRNKYKPLGNERKFRVPNYCKAILKRMGIGKVSEILLHLKPDDEKYAEASYAFIVDKKSLTIDTTLFKWDKTRQGDDYFVAKKWFGFGNINSTISGFNIGNKYFVLIKSQSLFASSELKAAGELGNTEPQLQTLLKNESRKTFLSKKDNINHIIDSNQLSRNYLKPITELQRISTDTIWKFTLEHPYFQRLITRISFLDNLDSIKKGYQAYRFVMHGRSTIPATKVQSEVVGEDAIKKVYEIAKKQKMMMINESHYDYRHRLFVTLLLDSLYRIGYRNLCVEDRSTRATVNNTYPTKEDGYYILEPFMAGLIRKAVKIGFNVYGYDDTTSNSIQEREHTQGKNLYNLYSKDPQSKWLILAGYSHINKKSFMEGVESAHQHFTKLAGFAPYSINQSNFSDITNVSVKVDNPNVGYYVVDTSGSLYKEGQSDLYIINNINSHPYEQPFTSIESSLAKYNFKLPETVAVNSTIFLYVKKEKEQFNNSAIPVYIGKVNKDKSFLLYLPKNEYVYVIMNSSENEIAKGEIATSTN